MISRITALVSGDSAATTIDGEKITVAKHTMVEVLPMQVLDQDKRIVYTTIIHNGKMHLIRMSILENVEVQYGFIDNAAGIHTIQWVQKRRY